MNEEQLDSLLRTLAARPLPPVPGNLEQNVWWEIRLRQQPAHGIGAWLDHFARLTWRHDFAFGSLAVAMVMGIGIGWFWQPRAEGAERTTARALGLHSFSAEAPFLPSTLTARLP